LPVGDLAPGDYSVPDFGIPLDLTIATPAVRLVHNNDESRLLWLEHDQGAQGQDTPTSRELLVTADVYGKTSEQTIRMALDHCSNPNGPPDPSSPLAKLGTTTTTFLGHPAVSVEFSLKKPCDALFPIGGGGGFSDGSFGIAAGHTVRIVSVDVNSRVVTAWADAPTSLWPGFSKEIDQLLASMRID
jgi:hypothetical protein